MAESARGSIPVPNRWFVHWPRGAYRPPQGVAKEDLPPEFEEWLVWYATVAAEVLGRRVSLGWTQAELAERANVGRSSVESLEKGTGWNHPVIVARLASAVGLSPTTEFNRRLPD
jgi:ribosome-binding protein aMBF1 (putative translation factor)